MFRIFIELIKNGFIKSAFIICYKKSLIFKDYQRLNFRIIESYQIPYDYCVAYCVFLYYQCLGYSDAMYCQWGFLKNDVYYVDDKPRILIDRFIFEIRNNGYDSFIKYAKELRNSKIY